MSDLIPAPLVTMREITGTLEEPGASDNPIIMKWADAIALRFPEMKLYCAQYTHDSIPWCGLCVAYVMARNGIRPIFGPTDTDKFLWARAWEKFGTRTEEPQLGDVLVFQGHVSLFDGQEGDYYLCRGGNQSDAVKVSKYHKSSVIAIRRPPESTATTPQAAVIPIDKTKRFTSITATVFGGKEDINESAYDGHEITDEEFGVALPARFSGVKPRVRVFRGDRSVDCNIVDVGPWNTNDKYWETNSRPQAESGKDLTGRPTNKSGIDLTPAAALALELNGKGLVDWMFIPTTVANNARVEKIVRDSSKKMRLFASIRNWMKGGIATGAGLATADNFGLFNSWLDIGNGKIPIITLALLGAGGVGVWWLINSLDKMSMDDYKAGRWMPSELSEDNKITQPETTGDDTEPR